MLAVKTTFPHPVTHLAFSPDGAGFAVAQPHSGITIFDRVTGRPTAVIAAPRVGGYTSLVFCENGTRLAAGSTRGTHLYDAVTGTLLGERGGWALARAVLAERDGLLLAANPNGLREVRPESVGGALASSPLPQSSIAVAVALSPCGTWAFGVRGHTRPVLLDLGTRKVAAEVDHPHRGTGYTGPAVCFAADGGRFAVCDGDDVRVYAAGDAESDAESESVQRPSLLQRAVGTAVAPRPRLLLKPIFALRRPDGVGEREKWRPPVAFTPDGRGLLVRRPKNRVQLWDVATGCHAGEWSWRTDTITALAVAPDGLTAAAGARFGRVVLWDLE